MHAVNVRSLKQNPSAALRQAEQSPVLVLKGDEPNALLVHLDAAVLGTDRSSPDRSIRPALAAALFKDGVLSLGAATRVSALPLQDFSSYLGELGIDIVGPDETTDDEARSLDKWLEP
jgi:antitoxin (DNA-binding transcriptional repressor) of toxin-antitoxin stability system